MRAARRRAGFTQTELARRAGLPIRTVHRIEHGQVDPRLGTVLRLLTECGWTLVPEARSSIDRSEIRCLLDMSTLQRLGWPDQLSWSGRAVRFLEVLVGRQVSFVVVSEMAERLHGAPVSVQDVQIRTLNDPMNARRLRRAMKVGNRRFARVAVTATSCSREAFAALSWAADRVPLPSGRSIPVVALEDLITRAPPGRAELLRCVREERDARPL